MRQQFQAFCDIDDGATAIEYGFLASLIAIAAFAAMVNLGDVIDSMYGLVSNGVSNAVATSSGSG